LTPNWKALLLDLTGNTCNLFLRYQRPVQVYIRVIHKWRYFSPVLLSLALVLGLGVSSRTNFESLALALRVKSLALALKSKKQKSLVLTNQVLGLARLVFRETNTATMLKAFSSHEWLDSVGLLDSKFLSLYPRLVKRVFSQSGLLMRPHRARMSDALLETLVFLKCNSAALGPVPPRLNSS